MSDDESSWHAVRVKPQHETVCAEALTSRDIETYVPTYKIRRKLCDRTKVVDAALLPGYVLTRFRRMERTNVMKAHGVLSIVRFGEDPAVIPDEEIDSLRRLVASQYPVEGWSQLAPGQKVRIDWGPLAGVTGIIIKQCDGFRIAVSVELLGRSVVATVDREAVSR